MLVDEAVVTKLVVDLKVPEFAEPEDAAEDTAVQTLEFVTAALSFFLR